MLIVHAQMLMSQPPSGVTHAFSDVYLDKIHNPAKENAPLTWKEILAEDPFEGQHWEGAYGFAPGSIIETWESRSDGTDSLSTMEDSESADDDQESPIEPETHPHPPEIHLPLVSLTEATRLRDNKYAYRQVVEDLKAKQYWRPEWHTDAFVGRPFDLGDASTLGPSSRRLESGLPFYSVPDDVSPPTRCRVII